MNLNGPVAEAIGWALLHLLWQGAVVAAILAAVLALLERRSANARYIASCAALALLLILGVATGVRAYEPITPASGVNLTLTLRGADVPVRTERTGRPLPSLLDATRESLPRVVLIWLIGVAFLSSRLLMTWLRTQRLARSASRAANEEWHRVVRRLASAMQLRRAVRLVQSAAVEVPSVIGWLRPIVLLPASTLTGLAPRQLEMVLAHELAHIRRHDFFINLLQAVVETLMFYHPAVWWMSRQVRVERENCCDDLAVAVCGDAIQYARALARLEELRADAPEVAMAANGGSLLARIRRIAGARAESIGLGSRWAAAVAMLSIVAIIVAIPSLPALAQREESAKKAEAPKKASTVVEVTEKQVTPEADDDTDVGVTADTDDSDGDAPEVPPVPVPPMPPAPAIHMTPMAVRVPHAMPAIAPMAPMTPFAPLAPGQPAPPMAMAEAMARDFEFEFGDDRAHAGDRPLDAAGKLTVDELIAMRAVGVTPEFMKTMRELFPGLTIHNVVSLKAVGVTPEWLKQMKAAGVEIKSANEAISLHAAGVTPDFVQRMAKAGYTNLTTRELTRLAAAGVSEDFIRDMEQYRKK